MSISRSAPAAPAKRAGEQARAGDLLERAEVRDVLAWMCVLVDPRNAAAVVRTLTRPPIELRQVDLARVIALARRRKLDLVAGLAAAIEAPQIPPEARERIQRFVELYRSSSAELDALAPEVFVDHLIERLGVRGRRLLAPADAAGRRAIQQALRGLVQEYLLREPNAGSRELTEHLASLAEEARERRVPATGAEGSPVARADTGGEGEGGPGGEGVLGAPGGEGGGQQEGSTPADQLQETFQLLREEMLASVARIGGCLGELRLDTDLDISHGVVRYLELLKLAALLQRPPGEGTAEALADINARLLAATTPLQREIFQTSTLDERLLADDGAAALSLGGEPSLAPFLPRKGVGLALSASDIETYRSCPLRYKFARVLRIPTAQTLSQRFGIAVHQVLERYHSAGGDTLVQLLSLLDAGWIRGGFGDSEPEQRLLERAREALTRYHERLAHHDGEPVWFERQFSFTLGPHHLRGRVDRVDRVRGAGADAYELIDYKTSRPKTAGELRDDVQLSLYALAARRDWGLESSRQAYYYLLDDRKVPVPADAACDAAITDTVMEVGEGILGQAFEPTPSRAACSICDYRIICPAAERSLPGPSASTVEPARSS